MSLPPVTLVQFFEGIVFSGLVLLLAIYIPVKLMAKWRRMRRAATHVSCRLCGYRFERADEHATCPHCQARNK